MRETCTVARGSNKPSNDGTQCNTDKRYSWTSAHIICVCVCVSGVGGGGGGGGLFGGRGVL